jgi:hypothetical protein
MGRTKIDPTVTRKAHASAIIALKKAHHEEYLRLVDEGYAAQGVESPQQRKARRLEAQKDKQLQAAIRHAQREQERLEKAAALLRAAGVTVVLPGQTEQEAELAS